MGVVTARSSKAGMKSKARGSETRNEVDCGEIPGTCDEIHAGCTRSGVGWYEVAGICFVSGHRGDLLRTLTHADRRTG